MKIEQTYYNAFEESIVAVNQKNENEIILLFQDQTVRKHDLIYHTTKTLFSLETKIEYTDGGFDIESACSIHLLDNIIVISNDEKTHSFVHYPEKYTIRLQREDYYADISKFPIALYKNENDVPHLIYATAWNRVEILNLEDCHNLTADKSLIEEDAEEKHVKYANPEKYGYHIWPSRFDYFYADLKISPDQKHFLSKGWAWGSSDAFYAFNIEDFIKNKRIKTIKVDFWEHESRAACWISNDEIIVCCNAILEDFDDADPDNPIEIVQYKLSGEKFEKIKRTKIPDLTDTSHEFEYSSALQAIVSYPKANPGLLIFDLDGKTILKNSQYNIEDFNIENLTFSSFDKHELSIYQIEF
ncbi:hypothetical protein [Empedobacter sedimenti]|uniref:hypothetical protein n=1 Tax=Empedobacter sedimenti TaxID=3042610 RepID=UPI0024A6A04B|nr:hypothetical protein [Empedobacter sedimenti]